MTTHKTKVKDKRHLRNRLLRRKRALLGAIALAAGTALILLPMALMIFSPETPLAQHLTSGSKIRFILATLGAALVIYGFTVSPRAPYSQTEQERVRGGPATLVVGAASMMVLLLFTIILQTFLLKTPPTLGGKGAFVFLTAFLVGLTMCGFGELIRSAHPRIKKPPDRNATP